MADGSAAHPGHALALACYRRSPMRPADDSTPGPPPPAANAEKPKLYSPGNAPASASGAAKAEKLNTKAAGIVGLAVLCSRILGLAREQIFAALFGGGRLMDAFTIAFRIPNLLRDLFAEGALSTSFITTFTKTIAADGDKAAWRLANKVATHDGGRAQRDHHPRHRDRTMAGARPCARL